MSNLNSAPAPLPATTSDVPRSIRWRLWAAMLAVALVPTMVGIYLMTSPADSPDAALEAQRALATSELGASLVARQSAIEARLFAAAADPQLPHLGDGVEGASEQQAAARILKVLQADDAGVIPSVCLVNSGDGLRVPLVAGAAGTRACADARLSELAGTSVEAIVRARPDGQGSSRLLIATPTRSEGRFRGVISAEIDTVELFGRSRAPDGDAIASMLVDMGASTVVSSQQGAAPADGAPAVDVETMAPYLSGILAHSEEARSALRAMGLAATVVPLWGSGDGTQMGLVQFWSQNTGGGWPLEIRLALMALLAGAIIAIIIVMRFFLDPFEEKSGSRAELQALYHEARRDALADELTGLGNHRAFQEELGRQIANFENRRSPFGLVLMDLDDLKVVNDREGHAAGDRVLISMAETMREFSRPGDHLFRTGGDEFAIILPDTGVEQAAAVAERILHFCKRPPSGRPSPFSSGVSGVPSFSRQRDLVYRQADAAMYWAKRHGRGSVEIFDPERDRLPDDLDDATAGAIAEVLMGKLLTPVFQPIVDLRTGRVLGFEGLIRPSPGGPLPDTNRLFAAAAASGRTVELDLACIEAVVNGARAIGPDRLLTLNLSPRTLEVKDFDPAWLLSGLIRNGISPSRVIVEVTEREEVDDLGRLQQVFNLLQQYGLRLAADDVGAGNSGLRLLSEVQFDIVKIDLALVQSGVRRMGARAVLQSLRELALSQNARMIAEGVETSHQLQVIRELDIRAGQGYLLGRPDVSLETTFVDVEQLESGVVVPRHAQLLTASPSSPTVIEGQVQEIPPERLEVYLPAATSGLEPTTGTA